MSNFHNFLEKFFNFFDNLSQIGYLIVFLFTIFVLFIIFRFIFIKFLKLIFFIFKKIFHISLKKINSSKIIKKIGKKYPGFAKFLKNRLDKNNFFGFPFTILTLLIFYSLFEFVGFTDAILNGDLITQIDTRLSDFFYYFKDIRLIKFFLFVSYFGNSIVILVLLFFSSILLFFLGKKIEIIGLYISVISSITIGYLSKILIERSRPEYTVYLEKGYSFPSLHSIISISFYSFIIWIFLVKIKKFEKRINLIFLGIFIAFLIGFSRLYLNVHYLSDVIAGWFLGFLGLLFGISIVLYIKHYFKIKSYYKNKINSKKKIFVIFFFLAFFLIFYYKVYYKSIKFQNFSYNQVLKIENLSKILKKKENLKYTETITGRKTEAINFIFFAKSDQKILEIFKKADWLEADKLGRYSLRRMGKALAKIENYNKAPITPLYWNGEIQDFGFQKLTTKNSLKFRHHIRIWKSNYKIGDYYIYFACGVFDNGLKWGITHKIDPDLDKEREYIFYSLQKTGLIKYFKKINLVKKYEGKNFSGDKFFTDGKAYLIKIK